MPVPFKIRGISTSKHKSENFALTTVYISCFDKNGHEVYTSITCKLHLVDGLKANMLVGNDVLCIKGFAINF